MNRFYDIFTSLARPPFTAPLRSERGAALGSLSAIRPADSPQWTWQLVAMGERVAALCLLLPALPLIAACALVLGLRSRRFPLIAHRRVGWQGEDLWMLKLRTMWPDGGAGRYGGLKIEYIDDEFGPEQKSACDARVSCRFARFCRRHLIDELPQLWHVVSGHMSLVGPRPVTARESRSYYGAHAAEILRVKPGLAGLWQVSGRNRLTVQRALPPGPAPGARAQYSALLPDSAPHPSRSLQRRKFLVTLRPWIWNPEGEVRHGLQSRDSATGSPICAAGR